MQGRTALWKKPVLKSVAVFIAALFVLSGCGSTGGTSSTPTTSSGSPGTTPTVNCTGQSLPPIKIGVSLSLSGDFSADGQAFKQGYQLWADTVNAKGGVLCRQVQLDIVSDASSTTQVVTNYQKLISANKDDIVFGPFSSLLTKPASVIASRFGYAMIEGAGGGPSVFTQGLHNLFDVSAPVANLLVSFTQYLLSLPVGQRPTTAAYATQNDPFTQPQVDTARALLEKGGVKTVSNQVYQSETTDYTSRLSNSRSLIQRPLLRQQDLTRANSLLMLLVVLQRRRESSFRTADGIPRSTLLTMPRWSVTTWRSTAALPMESAPMWQRLSRSDRCSSRQQTISTASIIRNLSLNSTRAKRTRAYRDR